MPTETNFSNSRYRNIIQITTKWRPPVFPGMRRTTHSDGSDTTAASTVTLRGLAATAGIVATLVSALAAPVATVVTLVAGTALVGVGALLASGRPARERDERERHRTIHRLLAAVAGHA